MLKTRNYKNEFIEVTSSEVTETCWNKHQAKKFCLKICTSRNRYRHLIHQNKQTLKQQTMKTTIEQMEQALRNINFFVGGLTDEGIEYHYNRMMESGKIK